MEDKSPCQIIENKGNSNKVGPINHNIFNLTFGNLNKFSPKKMSNSPLWLGHNFNSEGSLPPNFGLEDVFLKYELNKKKNNAQTILTRNNGLDSRSSGNKNPLYVRYFHTSDGARTKINSSSLEPYRDNQPYVQNNESSSLPRSFIKYKDNHERSSVSSENRERMDKEEDSPFFIKRRIRSSNPAGRIKRKAHPEISKHFFRKQLTRHGTRNKPSAQKISNTVSRSVHKEDRFYNNIYLWDGRNDYNSFSNYWHIEDPQQQVSKT